MEWRKRVGNVSQEHQSPGITNLVVITLDIETERFCQNFHAANGGVEVTSIRLELPVPTARQGSRGAKQFHAQVRPAAPGFADGLCGSGR